MGAYTYTIDADPAKIRLAWKNLQALRAERDDLLAVAEMLSLYDPLEFPAFYSVINKAKDAIAKAKGGASVTFVMFTKRTNDPKLAWLESQLTEAGISHQRKGQSYHAPILEVESARIDDAWDILDPVDDIPDDDPMFTGGE